MSGRVKIDSDVLAPCIASSFPERGQEEEMGRWFCTIVNVSCNNDTMCMVFLQGLVLEISTVQLRGVGLET